VKRLLVMAALAVSVVALPAATAVSATAATAHASAAAAASVPAATGYNRCPKWHLCFFNGFNGTGKYCVYTTPDRTDAVTGCGFLQLGWKVRSTWNRHLYVEQFYLWRNFGHPQDFDLAGDRGGYAGGCCLIRSFARVS